MRHSSRSTEGSSRMAPAEPAAEADRQAMTTGHPDLPLVAHLLILISSVQGVPLQRSTTPCPAPCLVVDCPAHCSAHAMVMLLLLLLLLLPCASSWSCFCACLCPPARPCGDSHVVLIILLASYHAVHAAQQQLSIHSFPLFQLGSSCEMCCA
jgi:hypothetical protein